MNFSRIAAAAAAGAVLAACSGQNGALPTQPGTANGIAGAPMGVANAGKSPAEINHWVPRYTTLPARGIDRNALETMQAAGTTIPYFTKTVTSPLNSQTYTYEIVGKDPTKSNRTTKVVYVPIVVRVHFPDGTVLDPTKPGCNDKVSVQNRFFKGPNFVNTPLTSNGVNVGKVQVVDGFQRAEFWNSLKGNLYHTVLKPAGTPIVVDYNAPSSAQTVAGVCADKPKVSHRIGEIDINSYDNEMVSLATQYATPTQVPIVLSYNVFETEGGCCILGYHSAFSRGSSTQTYAVGAYNDAGVFGSTPIEDIHAWTHEIGELVNDPFVANGTPPWGHVGQVSGCQNNLEVGDPLTGTAFTLKYNNFTYHPQELAFFDWFYRTPSQGTGGKFSFEGTFTQSQGACH
ncbi:MAG TPA: hypothetical protein VJP76_08105 [Candidatus Tumulicola sp.]|nr:hypothetical protein [Candidatus Tumulicola sp.]